MAPRIVIIDYHKGNLLSVARSLSDVGAEVEITDDPEKIAAAEALVLPGVGSFEDAMGFLDESGEGAALVDALARFGCLVHRALHVLVGPFAHFCSWRIWSFACAAG